MQHRTDPRLTRPPAPRLARTLASPVARLVGVGAIAALTASPALAHEGADELASVRLALEPDGAATWNAQAEAMLWFPALNGDLGLSDSVGFDIDLIDASEVRLAPAGQVTLRRGRWSAHADGFVFGLDDEAVASTGFTLNDVTVEPGDNVRYDIDWASFTLAGGYRLFGHDFQSDQPWCTVAEPEAIPADGVGVFIDAYAGARLHTLDFRLGSVADGLIIDRDETWIDPLAGLRLAVDLPRGFGFDLQSDLGGFGVGSDFAWNIEVGFFWQPAPNLAAEIGFRHLQIDYERDDFNWDITTAGLFGAIVLRF